MKCIPCSWWSTAIVAIEQQHNKQTTILMRLKVTDTICHLRYSYLLFITIICSNLMCVFVSWLYRDQNDDDDDNGWKWKRRRRRKKKEKKKKYKKIKIIAVFCPGNSRIFYSSIAFDHLLWEKTVDLVIFVFGTHQIYGYVTIKIAWI